MAVQAAAAAAAASLAEIQREAAPMVDLEIDGSEREQPKVHNSQLVQRAGVVVVWAAVQTVSHRPLRVVTVFLVAAEAAAALEKQDQVGQEAEAETEPCSSS
jgi:hypothetical protein